ncbi:MAG TPA: hypothetical protein VID27_11560 [Blastocatellia bacterium]
MDEEVIYKRAGLIVWAQAASSYRLSLSHCRNFISVEIVTLRAIAEVRPNDKHL